MGKSVVYIISLVVQFVTDSSQVQQLLPKFAVSNSWYYMENFEK